MKLILALPALLLLAAPAHARDGYASNGRPLVCNPVEYNIGTPLADTQGFKQCVEWISNVLQPHSKSTCCGEGDAYIADEWEQGADGGWVAVITRDYPEWYADDGEGGSVKIPAVPSGTRIAIPQNRIDDEHQGNPTGHGIVFFKWTGGKPYVLCFFTKTLT